MDTCLARNFLYLFGLGWVLSLGCCQTRFQNTTNEGCEGVFFLRLHDDSKQTICSDQSGEYFPAEKLYLLHITDKHLTGNTTVIVKMQPFSGNGIYRPGKNKDIHFDIHVKGATDELYHAFEGWMKVTDDSSKKMIATFDISLEGYYNKKIIHASGWMKINDSYQQYSNHSP